MLRTRTLLAAVVLAGALLGLLWLVRSGQRAPRAAPAQTARGTSPEDAIPDPPAPAAGARSAPAAPARASTDEGAPTPASEPALVSGTLRLDGAPPPGGRLWIASTDGRFESTAVLDPEGRFWRNQVPATALVLRFELEGLARALVLPEVPLAARPGTREELTLEWHSKQLNVRVLGPNGPAAHAALTLTGPQHAASLTADAEGKAALALVGTGSFTLAARLPGGWQGSTSFELSEEDELESLVVQLGPEER